MIVLAIILYGLSLYLAFLLYKKYNDRISKYIDEVIQEWPKMPKWLNWTLGILLFFGCISAQLYFLFESILIWLVLLFIVPFFYLPIHNIKVYNFLSVTTLFITGFFSLTMFFNIHNSRDIIGETFIPNYSVHYTTEHYMNGDYEGEVEVAHVNTGNKTLDKFLESIFPILYRILIGSMIVFSLLMNLSLREKNKIMKKMQEEHLRKPE